MSLDEQEPEQTPSEPIEAAEQPAAPAAAPEIFEGIDDVDVSDNVAEEDEVPAGVYLTPRRLLVIIAIVLGVVLIALIIFLLLSMRDNPSARVADNSAGGIKAELVIEGPGRGANPTFNRPMGVAWSVRGDYVYVADSENNRICIFARDGRFIREFGGFGIAKPTAGAKATWKPGLLNYPVDVAVDRDDNLYVADFYNDSISVFSRNGSFLRRFPDPTKPVGKGSSGADGKGVAVTAVDVEGDYVYATDGYQIVVFTLEGKYVRQFGKPGTARGALDRPNGVVALKDGTVVVSDSNNNRVQAFSPAGNPLWTAGSRIPVERKVAPSASLILPRGITVVNDESLLVADPLAQQLTEISLEGELGAHYGTRGTEPAEMNFPNDCDWVRSRIVIADRENNRVQIVRLVKK
ncbi:MAG TPA: hypothetical protein VFG89_05710 [Coriobacteriia bacterium]|nr:hypothetical protein [Coriobacteriia bacterium]